jgi:hypothetical protein
MELLPGGRQVNDPGDEHKHRDILERLDLLWPGMGEMANDERREAAREIRALRDEVRLLRALLPVKVTKLLYEGEG